MYIEHPSMSRVNAQIGNNIISVCCDIFVEIIANTLFPHLCIDKNNFEFKD